MSRQPRFDLFNVPHHVVQRGHNRAATFFAAEDYSLYLSLLLDAAREHACDIHAYVLMQNHVHLLLTPRRPRAISKVMQSVGGAYVRYINDRLGRVGTLWEGRYRASPVDVERYFLVCCQYIELNPVRAGLSASPVGYRWSSHRHNALGIADHVVTEHPSFLALGSAPGARWAAYRRLFQSELPAESVQEIRDCLNGGRVLGSDVFKDRLEATLSQRARSGRHGRPRKVTTPSAGLCS